MNLLATKTEPSSSELAVIAIEQKSASALEQLRLTTVEAFDSLWNCGRTAEMLQLMGSNAVSAFQQHARTVQFLLESGVQLDPSEYTPPAEYKAHEDGTITLV
jgi:hypothetical protein